MASSFNGAPKPCLVSQRGLGCSHLTDPSPQRKWDRDLEPHADRVAIGVAARRESPLMDRIDVRLIEHRDRFDHLHLVLDRQLWI